MSDHAVTYDYHASGTAPQLNQERFQFCLFVALLLHALLIFGVGFSQPKAAAKQAALEVTMAMYKSEKAPEKPDFLAQAHQQGSGSLDKKALPSTTQMADFHNNTIQEVSPAAQKKSANATDKQAVISTKASSKKITAQQRLEISNPSPEQADSASLLQRNMEIASLEARLAQEKQRYAKRPRKKQLTAASTQQAADAAYLDSWRTRIETIGNQDYEALGVNNLYGQLRLLVALNADGTIQQIQVLQSSGQKIVDAAAIKVVRMAAPFDPFPPDLRKDTDILEIIRTWKFEKGRYLSSY